MNTRCFHIALVIWIFAAVPLGLTENFQSRPAQAELETTVALGMECSRGVIERCFATQTATNPVTYSVSPPDFAGTNGGGWYLDQNMMTNLDVKAKALVPYYVDPDTVYEGTTNIVMLAVTSLWAQLVIGDRTNKFTGTPAIGTNPPTYGDYPWRIYNESLVERYKVLNACKIIKMDKTEDLWTKDVWPPSGEYQPDWATAISVMEARFTNAVFDKSWTIGGDDPGSIYTADGSYRLSIGRITGSVYSAATSVQLADISGAVQFFMMPKNRSDLERWEFDGNGVPMTYSYAYSLIKEITIVGGDSAMYSFPALSSLPAQCLEPTPTDPGYRGFEYNSSTFHILCTWDFQYCIDEY